MQNNIGGGAKCRREATEPQLVPLLGPRTRASGRRAFDRRHEAVAYTLFVYNPPPPPRRCIWAYSSLIHPDVSAFPERVVGSRYASTSSRLCLVAFTHVVACSAVSNSRPASRRLQPFRCLHDCSSCFQVERFAGWGSNPLECRVLTAHTQDGHSLANVAS